MSLEDKTEAPTARRRQEARDEGQVAKSVEINAAMVLITGLVILKWTGPNLGIKLQDTVQRALSTFPSRDLTPRDVNFTLVRLLLEIGTALAPLVLGVALAGFVSNVAQVGLKISGKALQVKGTRLNPLSGFASLFSSRAIVEGMKCIAKVSLVGYIIYAFLKSRAADIAAMAGGTFYTTCSGIAGLAYELLLRTSVVLLVIAALDYAYQRYSHEKQLKMTKQEVRDDAKRSDGDPQIKGKIRAKQREVAQRRMMAEVPKADVVVTNPTHFAVALKYDADICPAPIVVAKGKNLIAQNIKAIAEEHHVPIVENVQLARALYASVEISDEIPADLYQAVAEILAYVYRLSKRLTGKV